MGGEQFTIGREQVRQVVANKYDEVRIETRQNEENRRGPNRSADSKQYVRNDEVQK